MIIGQSAGQGMPAPANSTMACQAWAEGGGAEAATVRALLTRALARSLQAPRGLCRHPAAAGAVFRLLGLALRCARHDLVRPQGVEACRHRTRGAVFRLLGLALRCARHGLVRV